MFRLALNAVKNKSPNKSKTPNLNGFFIFFVNINKEINYMITL